MHLLTQMRNQSRMSSVISPMTDSLRFCPDGAGFFWKLERRT